MFRRAEATCAKASQSHSELSLLGVLGGRAVLLIQLVVCDSSFPVCSFRESEPLGKGSSYWHLVVLTGHKSKFYMTGFFFSILKLLMLC